jgi:hypothetical protein
MQTGNCDPCNGDFASGTPAACQLIGQPHCFLQGTPRQGECGKCTTDADCTGHPGPKCQPQAGICGNECSGDKDCKDTEWCAMTGAKGVCIPKTPNAQPVTTVPPYTGDCTPESGGRTCLSAVCEESDDLCGYKNGTPCKEIKQCRSNICFEADKRCGKPSGEPCAGNGECRSDRCENGVCAGCDDDSDCKVEHICDTAKPGGECVPGCRPSAKDGEPGSCPDKDGKDRICEAPPGANVGNCVDGPGGPGSSGGDPFGAGIIEGGGCSCRATGISVASPFALGGALFAGLLLARRRRSRQDRELD